MTEKHDQETKAGEPTSLDRYKSAMEDGDEPDPVERLRFFLSIALAGQDWIDVEQFIEAITRETKASEPVALHKFNCWSNNEGDSWFENPADAELIYEQLGNDPKVGDEFEVLAGWCSVEAKYRISEINDDDIEVECISHPTELIGAIDTPDTETLRQQLEDARRTAEFWKSEHLAGNEVIEDLRQRVNELEEQSEDHQAVIAECVELHGKLATQTEQIKVARDAIDAHFNPCGCLNGCEFCNNAPTLREAIAKLGEQ